MHIEGNVLLYGAGKEARSTRAFLKRHYPDAKVFVTVDSGNAEVEDAEFVAPDNLDVGQFSLIVKSPGVSLYKPVFDVARAASVPITSNLNIWADHFGKDRTVIAITGTKGKSTTATLVHLMLTHSGIDATLAGNVGLAPLDIDTDAKTVVLELSSYQTSDMDFAPDIAALTNLYPEHLDWHGSTERYYADKLNLFAGSPSPTIALGMDAAQSQIVQKAIPAGSALVGELTPEIEHIVKYAVVQSRLKGKHNLDNARLAARIALTAGASLDGLRNAIADFVPLPHRLEEIRIDRLTFVDDSISTTPQATKAALEAYSGARIALIAGGHDRGQDYEDLAQTIAGAGVAFVCCLPVTGTRLAQAVRKAAPAVPVAECGTLENAVQMLAGTGREFDTVILSPGAPSYNQFRNFEERGDLFKALVRSYFAPAS